MRPDTRPSLVIASLLVLAACAQDPREAVESRPATAALTQDMVAQPPVVATGQPRDTGTAAPPAIVVAQIGWKLGANGLLEQPATEIPAASAIYGMAIFRGMQDQKGLVELQVYDAGERLVSRQKARYTLQGDTPVVLNLKLAGQQWPQGRYRALYLCDGSPCWEVRFALL